MLLETPDTITGTANITGRPCNIILFNDEVHTGNEVVSQIMKATGYPFDKASEIMWEAHSNGRAIVFSGNRERCELVESILAEIKLSTQIEEA